MASLHRPPRTVQTAELSDGDQQANGNLPAPNHQHRTYTSRSTNITQGWVDIELSPCAEPLCRYVISKRHVVFDPCTGIENPLMQDSP